MSRLMVPIPWKKRLRIWRGKRRQKEAAAALNVPVGTYRKWEYGKRIPKSYLIPVYEQKMNESQDCAK
jgi:hypothetical protein